jgi:hypothetical protein
MTEYSFVNEREFPDGLCCIECGIEIPVGYAYTSRPDAVMADGSLIEELICTFCVLYLTGLRAGTRQ